MNTHIKIVFGAYTPTLKEQLELQGLWLSNSDLIYLDRLSSSITLLFLNSVATGSETKKMQQRLLNKIAMRVKPLE